MNLQTREIVELKPNAPRAIRLGEQQVQGYLDEATRVWGGSWTGRVETYP